MIRMILNAEEISQIDALLDYVVSRYDSVEDPDFLKEASLLAHDLPRRVRSFLLDFRLSEPNSGFIIISGYPIAEERIGPTPSHWKDRKNPSSTLREETLFVLMGELLGQVVAWTTQQAGYLVHDILPIKGLENEQLGSGSESLLLWHTEDAFHPYRGDYVGMMCLRNPDHVATTVGSLEQIELAPEQLEYLFEPNYTIRPDESHQVKNKADVQEMDEILSAAYAKIDEQKREPEKISVLFGHPESPYVRLDPYFMDQPEKSTDSQQALDLLVTAIDENLQDLVLEPGDVCFIDNFKAVHGRKPFKARYDGKDRWLKRVNVVRDLRKSRAARVSPDSRALT